MQAFHGDSRPPDRIEEHYVLEQQLAKRLLDADPAARAHAYTEAYNELFRRLPDHPQKSEARAKVRASRIDNSCRWLQPYLKKNSVFLEIGCGDGALSSSIATRVGRSFGLDVTDALIDYSKLPSNMSILLSKGTDVPLPDGVVDVAWSDQVMEHLHPGDAELQLAEIYRVLKPGGIYLCNTPNRVTGPHDISGYFGYEATGLHLREYDSGMLWVLFKRIGFRRLSFSMSARGITIRWPRRLLWLLERGMMTLPPRLRARLAIRRSVLIMTGIHLMAVK